VAAPGSSAIVVGGGFFGASVAVHLASFLDRVVLLEREPELLARASFANQARIHNGYHYPRSVLTAHRSRLNFDRFLQAYPRAVVSDFSKYYAVARRFSAVTAAQFRAFCERIGAPLSPAPRAVISLFDPDLVEAVFEVRELAFDARVLREDLHGALDAARVEVRRSAEVARVLQAPDGGGGLRVELRGGEAVEARSVFNCTYAGLNELLSASGLPLIPLRYEAAELALVQIPPPLQRAGVTVMCGPFFSVMPFPPRGAHALSHVRYTPHYAWSAGERAPPRPPGPSRFTHMVKDAARFLPGLQDARYLDSLWETKTILPSSEVDDSRPILFKAHHGLRGFFCVMGGKIDNVFDVLQELDALRARGELS